MAKLPSTNLFLFKLLSNIEIRKRKFKKKGKFSNIKKPTKKKKKEKKKKKGRKRKEKTPTLIQHSSPISPPILFLHYRLQPSFPFSHSPPSHSPFLTNQHSSNPKL